MRLGRERMLATLIGGATVLAVIAGLVLLSRADQQGARVAALKLAARDAVAWRATPAPTQPSAALCQTPRDVAIVEVAAALRAAGAASGVTLEALDFAPLSPSTSPLSGAQLHFVVAGGEPTFAGFLRAAGEARLPVFLDAVEIKRTGAGGVQAEFTGRVLCRRGRA